MEGNNAHINQTISMAVLIRSDSDRAERTGNSVCVLQAAFIVFAALSWLLCPLYTLFITIDYLVEYLILNKFI